MQRTDLEAEIGRLLSDPNHDTWDLTGIRARIEEASAVIQALTNAVKTVETLTPTAETKEVSISDQTLDIVRATYTDAGGEVKVLQGKSREDMDFYYPGWENWDSGLPEFFFYDATNHQLNLIRKPSATYALTDSLKVWEIRIPTALTADSSVPFNSNAAMQAYANSITHWVVAQCFMDVGTQEALLKSKFHKSGSIDSPGEFEKYIRMIRAKFDSPSGVPARIKWAPQGGRLSFRGGLRPSKSDFV
jgi:hypothetical protein